MKVSTVLVAVVSTACALSASATKSPRAAGWTGAWRGDPAGHLVPEVDTRWWGSPLHRGRPGGQYHIPERGPSFGADPADRPVPELGLPGVIDVFQPIEHGGPVDVRSVRDPKDDVFRCQALGCEKR